MRIIPMPLNFQWDKGNENKSLKKHGTTAQDSEEPFFDEHKKLWKDLPHSGQEARFVLLGQSRQGRVMFVAFTIRGNNVRIISARRAHKKERILYETAKKQKVKTSQV